ncbi:MAG: SGNH/GDSL hydrolase family protein [Clostridia bacterium]|nr:SGNH/GDSL hydrolase family protein [Clostridia bacterium]
MEKFTQDINEYLRPFWKGETMLNETLMFVGKSDVGVLLYEPEKIFSVKNYFLDKEYKDSADYKIDGKKFLCLSEKIPYWEEAEYYPITFEHYRIGAKKEICDRLGGERFLKYGEGDTFTKKQIVISYIHKDKWAGPLPQGKSEKFSKIIEKLKQGKPCKFLFYGDSITTGCNASGTEQGGNVSPYMPPFPNLVCEYLQNKYGSQIELINTAVGGMSTKWGLNNIDERVIDYKPDLVFIAFGMNDPATPRPLYKEMVKEMIEKTHKALPDAEIMLVSSILPNNESDETWFANQCVFHLDLAELEREYPFVGLANVTVMQEYILSTGKRYRDMTANNVNHPNDFGHRLYAQVILTTLLGKDFDL